MNANGIAEDLSLEGLLECLRRILIEEKGAARYGDIGEKALVLTNMVTSDGSIVKIAATSSPQSNMAPHGASDPFAMINALRAHVAGLLAA